MLEGSTRTFHSINEWKDESHLVPVEIGKISRAKEVSKWTMVNFIQSTSALVYHETVQQGRTVCPTHLQAQCKDKRQIQKDTNRYTSRVVLSTRSRRHSQPLR